jgi:hypothetical protein
VSQQGGLTIIERCFIISFLVLVIVNKLKHIFLFPFRPSTPVFDLLAHKYQDKWIEERRKAEEAFRAKQDQKVKNPSFHFPLKSFVEGQRRSHRLGRINRKTKHSLITCHFRSVLDEISTKLEHLCCGNISHKLTARLSGK